MNNLKKGKIVNITNNFSNQYTYPKAQRSTTSFGAKIIVDPRIERRYLSNLKYSEPGFFAKVFKQAKNPLKALITKLNEIHPEQTIKICETPSCIVFNYIAGDGFADLGRNLMVKNLTTNKEYIIGEGGNRGSASNMHMLLEGILKSNSFWENKQ